MLSRRAPGAINRAKTLPYVFEEFSEHGSIGSPKRQRHSVVQLYNHIATRRQIELTYVVEINDRIPMHADKAVWVKHSLEVLHALAKQMGRFPNVEPNVLPRRLHPLD